MNLASWSRYPFTFKIRRYKMNTESDTKLSDTINVQCVPCKMKTKEVIQYFKSWYTLIIHTWLFLYLRLGIFDWLLQWASSCSSHLHIVYSQVQLIVVLFNASLSVLLDWNKREPASSSFVNNMSINCNAKE